jgi:hypothetical protein
LIIFLFYRYGGEWIDIALSPHIGGQCLWPAPGRLSLTAIRLNYSVIDNRKQPFANKFALAAPHLDARDSNPARPGFSKT